MKTITAFACEFCPNKRRPFRAKSSVMRHEKKCFRNPETRSCLSCGNFEMVSYERLELCGGDVIEHEDKYPYCEVEMLEKRDGNGVNDGLRTRCEGWIPKTAEGSA